MRVPGAVILALLLGCSPAAGEQAADVPVVSIGEQGQAGLPKRLLEGKLEGLAMVWSDAVLFPSAALARKAKPKRSEKHHVAALHVLSDEGAGPRRPRESSPVAQIRSSP